MEYRYRDKVYLSSYMLDTVLFDSFDFLVEDAAPIGYVYLLKTNEGLKILKKVDYPIDELNFIYESLNEIRKNYPYVINYRNSLDGYPFVQYEGGLYIVLDIIDGRECVFENPIDLKTASKALARLHRAGENISCKLRCRNKLYSLPDRFRQRIDEMEKYRLIAGMHVNKSPFDTVYLEHADYYISCAKDALEHIENSKYMDICNIKHTLCHHDLNHHNILVGNDDNIYFLDFDYAVIDIALHDISNMITKAIKHNGWSMESAMFVIDGYREESEITRDELDVLLGYLIFPNDFYEISTEYYMRTRSWDEVEFLDKLQRKAGYREERENFIKEFKEMLL